jgi:hypothetical protein
MSNITMAIPAGLLRQARKLAGTKDTSVNAMIRKHLEEITQTENPDADARISRLESAWERYSFRQWSKASSREELYDR